MNNTTLTNTGDFSGVYIDPQAIITILIVFGIIAICILIWQKQRERRVKNENKNKYKR